MAKFSVGEVAVITFSTWEEFPVGTEVMIQAVQDHPSAQYLVAHLDGLPIYGNDRCLDKKQPPTREELGKWEFCHWRPGRVVA